MWSYIAGGLKIRVIWHTEWHFGTKLSGLIIKDGLKIKGCKIEGLLYLHCFGTDSVLCMIWLLSFWKPCSIDQHQLNTSVPVHHVYISPFCMPTLIACVYNISLWVLFFSETLLFLHQIFLKGLVARMENWPTLVLGELPIMLPWHARTFLFVSQVKWPDILPFFFFTVIWFSGSLLRSVSESLAFQYTFTCYMYMSRVIQCTLCTRCSEMSLYTVFT